MEFTVDWAEVRRRAFRTLFQVVAAVVLVLSPFVLSGNFESFDGKLLYVAAVTPIVAFVQNYFTEKRLADELNEAVKGE